MDGASPVYTKRMQRALGFEGDSVETIFKGMQIDIGAPPQFMDFRYLVIDHDHGEFWLDHCGALMDVEPMGPEYVVAMCHDIEDPTFDATAIATNPRAQVRPIHRPPRVPAGRSPALPLDGDHRRRPTRCCRCRLEAEAMAATRAATLELAPIDPDDPGRHEYAGPSLADLQFSEWSGSALRRIADEVCLQGHLLVLSFIAAKRPGSESGRGGDRVRSAAVHRRRRGGSRPAPGRARSRRWTSRTWPRSLALHPGLQPSAYVGCDVELDDRLIVRLGRDTDAMVDGAWPSMLDANIWALGRHRAGRGRPVPVPGALGRRKWAGSRWSGRHRGAGGPRGCLTRFSTGANHLFEDRGRRWRFAEAERPRPRPRPRPCRGHRDRSSKRATEVMRRTTPAKSK